jgi:transcriptional regulator with XRE-family HTH domain
MARSSFVHAEFVRGLLARGALPLPDACRAIRIIQGLSQDEFAKRSGVNRKVVKDLERGQGNPRWDSLQRIGRAAGLRVAFLPDEGEIGLLDPRKRLAEEEARRAADSVALKRGLNPKELHARNAMSLGGINLRLPKIA